MQEISNMTFSSNINEKKNETKGMDHAAIERFKDSDANQTDINRFGQLNLESIAEEESKRKKLLKVDTTNSRSMIPLLQKQSS